MRFLTNRSAGDSGFDRTVNETCHNPAVAIVERFSPVRLAPWGLVACPALRDTVLATHRRSLPPVICINRVPRRGRRGCALSIQKWTGNRNCHQAETELDTPV